MKRYLINSNKHGVTIIELLAFEMIVILAIIPAIHAYRYGGLWLAIPTGIASFGCIIGLLYCLNYIFECILPPEPRKCETGKCVFYNGCLHGRIGIEDGIGIIYFRCNCGHEYLSTKHYFVKINADGSLQPYYKRVWIGCWYKDRNKNSEIAHYRMNPELLKKLRSVELNIEDIPDDAAFSDVLQIHSGTES